MRVIYQTWKVFDWGITIFFKFQYLFDATSRCKDLFDIFKCVGCPQAIYREKTCKFEILYSSVRDALQNVLRLQRLRRLEIKLA